ncbi:MAG: DUF4040 domain-containing protein [Methanomicrobiaceae archaeon]|nr:DUF4040 domain-containing protein [Methanomicrobiaceae archaeon]
MIDILNGLVLIGLLVSALFIVRCRDLLSAAISFGIFSFLLSLEFYILQAPDVAIAEAGIGAGLTTAIFIVAIRGTTRWEGVRE